MVTPFPLLKCVRTSNIRHRESFSGQKCTNCRILHIESQIFSEGDTTDPTETPPMHGLRHQFPSGSPAFSLFLFNETATGPRVNIESYTRSAKVL